LEEALSNIREAIELCVEARREAGLPVLIESREVEVPLIAWRAPRIGGRRGACV
jgi:hypothetical protein